MIHGGVIDSIDATEDHNDSDLMMELACLADAVKMFIEAEDYTQAVRYQERLLQCCCDYHSHSHIYTLSVMHSLAGLLFKESKSNADAAEDMYIQTIALTRQAIATVQDSEMIAKYSELLGNCYLALGSLLESADPLSTRTDEVNQLFLDALQTYRNIFGENHPRTADALLHIAALHVKQREYDIAKLRCEQAYKIFSRIQQPTLAMIVHDTYGDIITKHVKHLAHEQAHVEAAVFAEQVCGFTIRGCPFIFGETIMTISFKRSSSVPEKTNRVFLAIFPSLEDVSDDSLLHFAWAVDPRNDATESIQGQQQLQSISAGFSRLLRRLSGGDKDKYNQSRGNSRRNSVSSDNQFDSIIDSNVDVRALDVVLSSVRYLESATGLSNVIYPSTSSLSADNENASCVMEGTLKSSSFSLEEDIPSPKQTNHNESFVGELESGIDMVQNHSRDTNKTVTITLTFLDTQTCQNWCDALQSYVSSV